MTTRSRARTASRWYRGRPVCGRYRGRVICAFDVQPDGELKRPFVNLHDPDGDKAGVGSRADGIDWVRRPALCSHGFQIQIIDSRGHYAGNDPFGREERRLAGPDRRTLYMTTLPQALYRVDCCQADPLAPQVRTRSKGIARVHCGSPGSFYRMGGSVNVGSGVVRKKGPMQSRFYGASPFGQDTP
jgi:hypothetical protein